MSDDKKITIGFVISCIVFLFVSYNVQKDMREVGFLDVVFGGFPLTHLVIIGGGTALIKCLLDKMFPPPPEEWDDRERNARQQTESRKWRSSYGLPNKHN